MRIHFHGCAFCFVVIYPFVANVSKRQRLSFGLDGVQTLAEKDLI